MSSLTSPMTLREVPLAARTHHFEGRTGARTSKSTSVERGARLTALPLSTKKYAGRPSKAAGRRGASPAMMSSTVLTVAVSKVPVVGAWLLKNAS